ncbi:exodeoxyribonuclease V subunit gamma [Mycobacterium haemophilum DSM 44634]|uniref:exodeoxyribonuclease V subunit gamma n=1 Tax=Mycobacterium haemophilum TaxID=29311 RepID=UPI000654E5FC|nr:exodeoxyribonuclease V subunit gamma [Mycobacterium haemophilum]AKN18208.1 exodeoxyribonuclease V subunit gamma [Mycobacterium haemophilum DSM 44634]MCV7341043.1 exodeoxyribonuclease V subunit gamma [Mycobacterium haemophilum DSM 44634]
MALHLHRAGQTDLLADGLCALLADPLPDPFAEELVLVSARGVERWLSQRLSHVLGCRPGGGDGVCAGVTFRSPTSLISEILGITGTAAHDPWSPEAMTWPLLEVIDANLDEPWCGTLAKHLGHFDTDDEAELRKGRRYAVARRIAGLFAGYARQRPCLLVDWLDGEEGGLDADLAWQPQLWRLLVANVAVDPPHVRHRNAVTRLRASPTDLPARLSLFGHTRLAVTDIELLDAVATHHDLHLWLPHPSDELWRALAGRRHRSVPRTEDTSRRAAKHPLLQTLGRDLRELQSLLPARPATDEYLGTALGLMSGDPLRPAPPRLRSPLGLMSGAEKPNTLLGWLQSDITANAVRPQNRVLAEGDRSVQVHACHGTARQIDVLREVLLGLLADDPTLEPRDIVVMCPDIETCAPLIVADFGLGELPGHSHPAHRLRVRLADRALTQTNPLLGVAGQLLGIADSRTTATQVLNLAAATPVRARFGFTDDDLDTITTWVRDSGIRWSFDTAHRKQYGLDHIVGNTWRFGLDRILTGVAMSDDSQAWLSTALPLDDVGSNRVELAGRLAEYIHRLQSVVDSLDGIRPLSEWIEALTDGVAQLTRVGAADAWQPEQLRREFATILAHADFRRTTALRLSDVRALLAEQLAGRPTRANFRTGTLTACTMVPMRSVPHRVVCLVGLDDGVFPRLALPDGDDVLARRPMTGERDIRSEDRQLLLDAICAARQTLIITYTGADEHTGHPRPPSVPLAELLDALDQTTPASVRDRVLIEHPLQPFDIRNVTPGELVPDQPFTFDPTVLVAARAAAGDRHLRPGFYTDPLPEPAPDDVALADLLAFFRDPVKGFFRALDYTLPWDVDEVQDEMPVEIDSLEEWAAGDRMLRDMVRGMDADAATQAEWRRGALPPGQLGWRKAKEIRTQAAGLAAEALRHRRGVAAAYDINVELDGQRRLTGTVTPVFGTRTVSVTYSRLGGKHLLEAWIPLLALQADKPHREWTALCIGRAQKNQQIEQRLLGPPTDPRETLRDLVRLYDAGRREPLPLPLRTSYAWADARNCGRDPVKVAGWRWNSQHNYRGEDAEPAHERVWGTRAPLDVLLGTPRPGEEAAGEGTRLGALSARLWLPLLRAERSPREVG